MCPAVHYQRRISSPPLATAIQMDKASLFRAKLTIPIPRISVAVMVYDCLHNWDGVMECWIFGFDKCICFTDVLWDKVGGIEHQWSHYVLLCQHLLVCVPQSSLLSCQRRPVESGYVGQSGCI